MKSPRCRLSFFLSACFLLTLAGTAMPCLAQEEDRSVRDAYFRAVGEYFDVGEDEVGIIGEWRLAPDEVPVVLFLAGRAGISPDALIGLRRGGRPWMEVAGRFGLDAGDFHIPLPEGAELGPLAGIYEEFRGRPPGGWSRIILRDPDIVALVNIGVLSEVTGSAPLRVLQCFTEAGSFMEAYPVLLGR